MNVGLPSHLLLAGILTATILTGWAGTPSHAQVTGVSYTLSPVAGRVYFDKNAGLEDGTFIGGRVGFGFGEYAELSGIYLVSNGLRTSFAEFDHLGEEFRDRFALLPRRDVDVTQMGAELKFNLGRGSIFPFLSTGTGILRFDPENLDQSRLIYLSGSAGLQLGLSDHFAVLVQVEDLVYRYKPSNVLLSENDLSDLGLTAGSFRQVNVNNLALRVGIQIYAGGRARGELTEVDRALRAQLSRGLSGISLQVEPMAGVIDFADELRFREAQRMVGISAGFDLGPYLGLRGLYWRGIEGGSITDFDRLQAFGGEIKLKFGAVAGVFVPHLSLGGGYLDVLSGYEGNGFEEAVDRPFAMGGAGLSVALTDAIHAHGAVRSLLMSTESTQTVNDPSQLAASMLYGAGISFGIGRRTLDYRPPSSDIDVQTALIRRQNDSLRVALLRAQGRPSGILPADSAAVTVGERWVTLPIPASGELYVRYGEPSEKAPSVSIRPEPETAEEESVTAEDIRRIVRETLQREIRERGVSRDDTSTVRRLLDRIDELERRLEARDANRTSRPAEPTGYRLESFLPVAGFSLSPVGAVAGLRADFRSPALVGARFIPEVVAMADDEGLDFGINGGAAFPLGFNVASVRPYAGLGLGLITHGGVEMVFNLFAGAEQVTSRGRFFGEYMSQDFFDLHRIVLGYRLSF